MPNVKGIETAYHSPAAVISLIRAVAECGVQPPREGHLTKMKTLVFALGLFLASLPQLATCEETRALEQEFLFTEEELAETASKRARSIREAQQGISVVDGDDIMCCVPLRIPQALRVVPGLEVAIVTSGDAALAVRGFNAPLSNKMLVTLEGSSIHLDFYGMIPWGYYPLSRHEIDRIEVIKGPGSALYGANAFGGVINIIPKPPEQIQGTRLGVCVGSENTFETTILHAAVLGRFDYKISGSWGETKRWSHRCRDSKDVVRIDAYAGFRLPGGSQLSLRGGRADGRIEALMSDLWGKATIEGDLGHVGVEYRSQRTVLRTFWNQTYLTCTAMDDSAGLSPAYVDCTTYDTELRHHVELPCQNTLTLGGNFRYNWIESSVLDTWHMETSSAWFVEDEFRPSDRIGILVGGRSDYHPRGTPRFMPRGSVLYGLVPEHYLRFSAATAFRNPTSFEAYAYTTQELAPGIVAVTSGNEELVPEKVTSFEFGYRGTLLRRVTTGLNIFYNKFTGFIHYEPLEIFASPPAPAPGMPSRISYVNSGRATAVGGEIDVRLSLRRNLKGFFNYSHKRIEDADTGEQIKNCPSHVAAAGLSFESDKGLNIRFNEYYVGEVEREIQERTGPPITVRTPHYSLATVDVRYPIGESLEVAVGVFNVFNVIHAEYPVGERIDRRMSCRLSYVF